VTERTVRTADVPVLTVRVDDDGNDGTDGDGADESDDAGANDDDAGASATDDG
jgi:hypothetical protein